MQVMKEKHKQEVQAMQQALELKESSANSEPHKAGDDELFEKVKHDLCD
jgi:hypothetical protein